jgi:hypothetical protein
VSHRLLYREGKVHTNDDAPTGSREEKEVDKNPKYGACLLAYTDQSNKNLKKI